MSRSIPQHSPTPQEQHLVVCIFKLENRIGKGLKERLKSLHYFWNSNFQGWMGPIAHQKSIETALNADKVRFSKQVVHLPPDLVPSDPKTANLRTRLEILEETTYKEDRALLQDIYPYDPSLRPEDFDQPPPEQSLTENDYRIHRDFHERWVLIKTQKEEIEQIRQELARIESEPPDKILDPEDPLFTAEALLKERFSQEGHRTLHYCSDTFWQWDGSKHLEVRELQIRKKVYDYLRDAKKLTKDGVLVPFKPAKFRIDQILDALRSICYQNAHPSTGPSWLDGSADPDPKYVIPFRNGLLNVLEWLQDPNASLIPHTPLFLNAHALTFDFSPTAPVPSEWYKFLESIWGEDLAAQETLQEWMGYLLLPDTRYHKILLLVGPPRSGKGTIGRIIQELLGHSNVAAPLLSTLNSEFGLQPLLNKLLALISDARLTGKGSNNVIIERLLSISGEDSLTINRKFLTPITVQLPTRIMIMTNELPDMRDASGALTKRYLILTMQKSWYGHEDTALLDRLTQELPGILLWALQGLERLLSRGRFLQPLSSMSTVDELEAMTSPIRAFIDEICELHPHAKTPASQLFEAWKLWCESTGYTRPGNIQSFGKNLRAAYPQLGTIRPQEHERRERYYTGIAIRPQ